MQGYTLYTVYNFNNNNMYGITCVKILIIIISYFRKMSGIINPMNHVYFQKWREYVEGRGGKIFCSVLEGGKVTTTGDRALFDKYLVQDFKNWIPPTPLPKLPAKLLL